MRILIEEDAIRDKVAELGRRLRGDYAGKPLTILGVLTGSLVLLADLIRAIDVPHRVGLIQASSYRGTATAPGALQIDARLMPDVENRHVLLVDDIFDTGQTLATLLGLVRERKPASVRSAVLLWKEGRRRVELEPDYHCFKIPDVFVVGYGLDYNDDYRHIPYVAVLEDEELSAINPQGAGPAEDA